MTKVFEGRNDGAPAICWKCVATLVLLPANLP